MGILARFMVAAYHDVTSNTSQEDLVPRKHASRISSIGDECPNRVRY